MIYLAPVISGAALFGVAVTAMLLKIEIQTQLMVFLTLAAILVSLPAIKKFQFSKEGFSLEPIERGRAIAAEHVRETDKVDIPLRRIVANQNRITLRAMAFFYGTVSGVLSASIGYDQYYNDTFFGGPTTWWESYLPAPPL